MAHVEKQKKIQQTFKQSFQHMKKMTTKKNTEENKVQQKIGTAARSKIQGSIIDSKQQSTSHVVSDAL
jgi:hypothetical protein